MARKCDQFAAELVANAPFLSPVLLEEQEYWRPELAPETCLMGRLGNALVRHWGDLHARDKMKISGLIESAVSGDDKHLGVVVATGLVEAMLNAAQTPKCTEADVLAFLGTEARSHAEGWLAFYAGEDPTKSVDVS